MIPAHVTKYPESMSQDLPELMRAVLLRGHGGFEQLDYRSDVPVPRPRPGEVLVRIGAAGVNNTDINTRTGWYSRSVRDGTTAAGAAAGLAAARADDAGWTGRLPVFPRIQGADGCGRIVAVGAGVDAARCGERVLIEPVFRAPPGMPRHAVTYVGSECDGTFAEFCCVPAVHAHRITSALSDAELASFPCSYSAALNMLTRLELVAGDRLLITGASGGVGSAAVQLASRRGADVIAIAAASKHARLRELGAARVVDRGADLRAVLGSESVDAVVDVVGGVQFPTLLDLLRRGGRYAVAGAIAGPCVDLDLRTLYLKDLRLLGCTVLDPGVFERLVVHIERGDIVPLVAAIHPLSAIVAAQQEFLAKRHTGKIVLLP